MQGGGFGLWGWAVFWTAIGAFLVVDLYTHRGDRAESRSSAIAWSVAWIALGLAFAGIVWLRLGGSEAQEYIAAYLIEKSLSLDNLFVFLVIFQSLKIPKEHQRTVLYWGASGRLVSVRSSSFSARGRSSVGTGWSTSSASC